uniref:Uncharacterized protein n=1 Tax=Magnetococcus massalia (strain MO-1) TaxID=451514 RepID=A0A1S7LGM0_MAGMO|nr:Protein of unknown function [Candidatus Magnetococcus massalia]
MQAQRRAAEAEQKRLKAEQQAKQKHRRVAAIYRGEAGHFGDLIRVSILKGSMKFGGKHRAIHPAAFKLADGEHKEITFYSDRGRHLKVWVAYAEGTLLFDTGRQRNRDAKRIAYTPKWRKGQHYRGITLDRGSHSQAQGLELAIQVIRHLRH